MISERKAYLVSRRYARPGARAVYKYGELIADLSVLLPNILYSAPQILWLTELELSFVLLKYGNILAFSEHKLSHQLKVYEHLNECYELSGYTG